MIGVPAGTPALVIPVLSIRAYVLRGRVGLSCYVWNGVYDMLGHSRCYLPPHAL